MTVDEDGIMMEMATLISQGRYDDLSNVRIAHNIMMMLKRRARTEVKPKRGINFHSMADTFRGR